MASDLTMYLIQIVNVILLGHQFSTFPFNFAMPMISFAIIALYTLQNTYKLTVADRSFERKDGYYSVCALYFYLTFVPCIWLIGTASWVMVWTYFSSVDIELPGWAGEANFDPVATKWEGNLIQ